MKRSTALVQHEVVAQHKGTKRIHHQESGRKKVGKPVRGEHIAMVKVSNGITIAHGYQSVRLDIGVEMPVNVRVNKFEDLRDGFSRAYALLEEELVERSVEVDKLVRQLARRYQ